MNCNLMYCNPLGHSSDGAPKHDIDKGEDIASDPGGKQTKVEEPLTYDSVDTPHGKRCLCSPSLCFVVGQMWRVS